MFNSFAVLIPIESGEKGSVAVTFFLAYGVFVSSVTYELPSISNRTPILSYYIVYMSFFSGLAMFYSIVETFIYFKLKLRARSREKLQDLHVRLSRYDVIAALPLMSLYMLTSIILLII